MTLYVPKDYLTELNVKSGELNRDKLINTRLIGYNFTEEGGKDNVPILVSMMIRTAKSNKIYKYEGGSFTHSIWLKRIKTYELEKGIFLILVNLGDMIKNLTKCRTEVFQNTMPVDHGFIYSEEENKVYLINHVIVDDEYAEEFVSELKGNWVDISEAKRIAEDSKFSKMVLTTVKSI